MKNKLLVIIVTFNPMKWVDKCFDSLLASKIPCDIFVVDNGSTDGSQEYIKNKYPDIIFNQSKENLGFGRANNIGLKYALKNSYDYVYLLNQDAWVMPDTFEKMITLQKKNPVYGILSPLQLQANLEHVDRNFLINLNSQGIIVLENILMSSKEAIIEVDMTMAAHWLISKNCLEIVGGFSPAFPHYSEDNNYADRAIFHGFKNGIVLNALAVHDREYRQLTSRNYIYTTYIDSIMNMSYIKKKVKRPLLHFYFHSLKNVFIHKSFLPLRYIYRFTRDIKSIIEYREISKGKGVFIDK